MYSPYVHSAWGSVRGGWWAQALGPAPRGERSGGRDLDASYFALAGERRSPRRWMGGCSSFLVIWASSRRLVRPGAATACERAPRVARRRSLFRICFMGGWSVRSAAVYDYIDATCPDTPAARRFFGWLARH